VSARKASGIGARSRAARVLIGVAVAIAVVALVLGYASRALLRPQPFADRAVAALQDPAVQRDVTDHLTDAIVSSGNGDLVTVRPLVRSVVESIVGSQAFAPLFRRSLLDAHEAVMEHHGGTIHVNVADAGVLVQGALERVDATIARRIGAERVARLLTLRPGGTVLAIARIARRAQSLAWVLAVIAVLTAVGAMWMSPDRRNLARRLGIGLVLGGLAIVVLLAVGRIAAEHAAPPGRGDVARALWGAFLGGLRVQALWVAAAGAVCAGAASGRIRTGGIDARLAQGWRLLAGAPATRRRRLARGVASIAFGLAIVFETATTVAIAVQAAGLYLLYRGVGELLSETVPPPAPAHKTPARARRARRLAPAALAVVALASAFALVATGVDDGAPAATPLACDGRAALCDRPLNDVALAATHNSMGSVTIPSWLFGQQDATIAQQLRDGVRGLLIDTYNATAVPGGVRTDLGRVDSAKHRAAVQEIGAPAVDAALRIRARLGHQGEGEPGIFLCHTFCELGAVPLDSALGDIRSFLVANPGAVVVIVNQDEGVSPAAIQNAFAQAGLLDLVYRGPVDRFPTLGAMIDSGQRLVVLAENDAGSDIPWYHLAYQHALQETPYRFTSASELTDPARLDASCRPNRGPASAPLFLLNNWVDTSPAPRPSLAEIVNAHQALLARARTCERLRKRIPNLVAVDFYRRGDVFGVVDALNGLAPQAPSAGSGAGR
jgi:hypothetical protein